jgi:UDP:flavonoid glycosyltransferase YjiC (YdhE family)
MVAVPQMAEQRANADRLVQLGLGRQLDPNLVTAAAVREAAETVLNDADVRASVGLLQREIRSAGGAAEAANIIESAPSVSDPVRAR